MSRIIPGINPVIEALRASPERVRRIDTAASREKLPAELLSLASAKGIPIDTKDRTELDRLAGGARHQGVIAVLDDYPYSDIDAILSAARKSGDKAFIVVLDSIQDPHNLGAIIRSAECAGVHGIIIPKDRACAVTPTVEKVAAGAAAHMRIARVTNLSTTLKRLKDEGLWIAGADGNASRSLYEQELHMDLALVIGGEDQGIRPLVKRECDFLLSLPLMGNISSLNASASAAIFFYEILRRRMAAK